MKIQSGTRDLTRLVGDYLGLRYWETHSFLEGYEESCDVATERLDDFFKDKSIVAQSIAGSGVGVVKLFAAMPFGIIQYGAGIVSSIPKGVPAILDSAVMISAKGFVLGGIFVYESISNWFRGGLSKKSPFAIANEVTGILGMLALLYVGVGQLARQVRGLKSEFCFVEPVANTGFGGVRMGSPLILQKTPVRPMSVSNEYLDSVLNRTQGNRSEAARVVAREKRIEISVDAIIRRIKKSMEGSILAKFKVLKGKTGGSKPRISIEETAEVLRETFGNRTLASKLLKERGIKIGGTALGRKVLRSEPSSVLNSFRELKGHPPGFKPRVSEKVIYDALKEALGSVDLAAKILNADGVVISKVRIYGRIKKSQAGSVLFEFKRRTKPLRGTSLGEISDVDLAKILKRGRRDMKRTLKVLRMRGVSYSNREIWERILSIPKGSELYYLKPQLSLMDVWLLAK